MNFASLGQRRLVYIELKTSYNHNALLGLACTLYNGRHCQKDKSHEENNK